MTSEIECSAATLETMMIIKNVINLIHVIVPIILVVSCMFSVLKATMGGEADFKKLWGKISVKVVCTVTVFILPYIINFAMNIVEGIKLTENNCWKEATTENVQMKKEQEENERKEKEKELEDSLKDKLESGDSSSGATSSKTENFELDKSFVVLGDYDNYIGRYKIVIKNKKGKKIKNSNFKFSSDNKAIASVDSSGKIQANFGGKTKVTVTSRTDKSQKASLDVIVVHNLYTYVKTNQKVKGKSLITGKTVTLKKGTTGIFNGIARGTSTSNMAGSPVGDIIKVGKDYIKLDVKYVTAYKYYISDVLNKKEIEEFINSHNFESDTKYLFWNNQGTQMSYMFTGKKGKWKIYKKFMINTGDSAKVLYPTYTAGTMVTGVHLSYKVGELRQGTGKYPAIWKRHNDGQSGGNPWHEDGTGKRYPASHGCTRYIEKDIKYLVSIHSKIYNSRIVDF